LSAKEKYLADCAFAYLLRFHLCLEAGISYLFIYDASYRTPKSKASGETPGAINLVYAPGIVAVKQRLHKSCLLLAKRVSF
jgi:hypothetical protein